MSKIHIQFRLDERLADELERIASANGNSVSLVARNIVESAIIERLPLPDEDPFRRIEKNFDDLRFMLTNLRDDFTKLLRRQEQFEQKSEREHERIWGDVWDVRLNISTMGELRRQTELMGDLLNIMLGYFANSVHPYSLTTSEADRFEAVLEKMKAPPDDEWHRERVYSDIETCDEL